jgi:long-chain acyl-CoA synthetase
VDYQEAVAAVTAPGAPFELERITVRGVEYNAFKNAPRTLREVVGLQRGDDVFLVYEDERLTFAEVQRQIAAFGHQLVHQYGVAKGDRVAIGMRNYPEWIVAFAAVVSIGAISVSLNAWWTEDELAYALEDCGATLLVADAERIERTAESRRRLGVRAVGVRGATGAGVDPWDLPLGEPLPDVAIDPDDDVTILYTSGTTGRPKGAVSTHRAVTQAIMAYACRAAVESVRAAADGPPPTPKDPPSFILIVPLFHVTGSVPVLMSCFLAGLKLVIMYKWDPDKALQLIERERITTFVGVPTQAWDLLESPNFTAYDTSSLVSIGGGGAPSPPELVKRIDSAFEGRPNIGYGMTETNSYGPGHSGDDYVSHPTSTGRFVPMLEMEARDPLGQALPAGEVGELWFKGPHLIRGYWKKPEATAETIVDGWLRSGDLGRIDADGFVYVLDRAKDMVLRAGENVYCAEVEAAIYEHPAVYEAAVYGVPHPRLGEEVAAAVMLRDGTPLTAGGLRAFLRERIASFKIPTIVDFVVEPLPRNPAGKILKRQLRDSLHGS